MPSLTPLHFIRDHRVVEDGEQKYYQDIGPSYGYHRYTTDCGRFMIFREQSSGLWKIGHHGLYNLHWNYWLLKMGVHNVGFTTRRDALYALHVVCEAEGVL